MARTITVTKAGSRVRSITVGGRTFPIGKEVTNVAEKTIEALQEMPGVHVDIAGDEQPDADTPEPEVTEQEEQEEEE